MASNTPKIIKDFDGENNIRQASFQKMYDYYVGDLKAVLNYVRGAMSKVFKPLTVNKMPLPTYLIVKRIIDRLCMVYIEPAERYVQVDHTYVNGVPNENSAQAKDDEVYQELLEASNINSVCKEWHRLAKLLDTIYVQPVWREDHIEYDIYPPHLVSVEEDESNYLKPNAIWYQAAFGPESYWVYWSETEHWVLDEQEKVVPGKNEWNGVNKYGVIPMVPLRLKVTDDHWGYGDQQLVDINEQINVLLASSAYNSLMQSHGQAFAINLGFKDDEQIQTGPDKIIQAKNVSKDMVAPDFKFVQPNPATDSCMTQIDWMVKTAAMMRGLPADSVSVDSNAKSGAAKAIDNWELLELREDDIEWLRKFEKDLFEVSRIVWNFHNSQKKISDKATFGIDFELPEAPVAEKEELESKQIKMELGLWTPVDDMIDEAEGIDEETAKALIAKNFDTLRELGLKQESAQLRPDGTSAGAEDFDRNGRPGERDDQEQGMESPPGEVVQG